MSNLFYQCTYFANLCSSLFWRVDNETTRTFTGGEGNGVTSLWHTVRLVLLSSPISSPFIYFRIPRDSIFTLLLLCSPSYLTPWLVHRNFLPKFLSSYTFSLSSNSLDDISRSSSLYLTPPPLPSSLHIKIINSHSCSHSPSLITPTSPPFRRRLLRIVLRFFGYCPRAGLFTATTLSRFWNSVATYAWLGLALAVSCAFYAVFASPSQDKLSGL